MRSIHVPSTVCRLRTSITRKCCPTIKHSPVTPASLPTLASYRQPQVLPVAGTSSTTTSTMVHRLRCPNLPPIQHQSNTTTPHRRPSSISICNISHSNSNRLPSNTIGRHRMRRPQSNHVTAPSYNRSTIATSKAIRNNSRSIPANWKPVPASSICIIGRRTRCPIRSVVQSRNRSHSRLQRISSRIRSVAR